MSHRARLPEIRSRTLVYDDWYRLYRLELDMPDGATVPRHLLEADNAVAVLPFDLERRCVTLIRQPRAAVMAADSPPLLEAIAGMLEGDAPKDKAREEAFEEAGVCLRELIPISNIWSWAPVSTERIQLFLAPYCATDRIGAGGGAPGEHENIDVIEIEFSALYDMVETGVLTDAKTLILVQALMLRVLKGDR